MIGTQLKITVILLRSLEMQALLLQYTSMRRCTESNSNSPTPKPSYIYVHKNQDNTRISNSYWDHHPWEKHFPLTSIITWTTNPLLQSKIYRALASSSRNLSAANRSTLISISASTAQKSTSSAVIIGTWSRADIALICGGASTLPSTFLSLYQAHIFLQFQGTVASTPPFVACVAMETPSSVFGPHYLSQLMVFRYLTS